MFRFANSEYFYLLALIPVLIILFSWMMLWRKRALQRFGESPVIALLIPEKTDSKLILKFVLMMLACGLLIFVLAGPQTGSRLEKIQRKGIDLIIALDVSNSMLAQDIKPNRLERSKQAISRLVDKLQGDRIGLIVFAGKAYTQLPITTDYAAAKLFVSTVNPGMIPTQGTAIGDAIALAIQSFGNSIKNKAIIIISDGEDHQGSVLDQTELAASKGIQVYTIGMGLPEGVPIPQYQGNAVVGYKKDREGKTVVSKLDETLLQQIATIGKGMYVRATNSETGLNKIFDDINALQKSEIESRQFSDFENQFQYFLVIALVLLILDLFIFEKKTFWMKHIRPFSAVFLVFISLSGFSQKEYRYLREGNREYQKREFAEAEKDYRKALEINKESVKGQFNLGTAVYQGKNYKESAGIYSGLGEQKLDRKTRSEVFHNMGNSLLEDKDYTKSIDAYKQALISDPTDLDTKYNLEYAKMMLKQQQQQQQKQNQQKQDQQKEDQQEKQDQQNQDQQDQQKQPPKTNKISKEDAERMLEAMKNDEKKTMEKVKKQKAKVVVSGIEKDW